MKKIKIIIAGLLFLFLAAAATVMFLRRETGTGTKSTTLEKKYYRTRSEYEPEDAKKQKGQQKRKEQQERPEQEHGALDGRAQMEMVIFKIGKADAILLSSGERNVLIDTGEDDDGQEILSYMEQNGIDKLDALILTHFDKDHVGGADRIVKRVEILKVYQPDYDSDSGQFEEYDTNVRETDTPVEVLSGPVNFTCGRMEIRIYPPLKGEYKEENDYSLITSVTCGKNRLLFSGDAETERLKELMDGEQAIDGGLEHAFLKLPHHGRWDAELESFLDAVAPSCAAITCSEKNPADGKVLALLKEREIAVFLTSDGNIYGEIHGESLNLWQ